MRNGRVCTAGTTIHGSGFTVTSTLTQHFLNVTSTAVGTAFNLRYSVVTKSTSQPTSTSGPTVLPYLISNDGTLQTRPGAVSQPGIRYSFTGFEVYPTIAELRAGEHRRSTITMNLTGTTAASEHSLRSELLPGQTALKAALVIDVGPAPRRAFIQTGQGGYRDLVGVAYRGISLKLLNGNATGNKDFASLGGLLKTSASGSVYLARGVGFVDTVALGQHVLLRRCTG